MINLSYNKPNKLQEFALTLQQFKDEMNAVNDNDDDYEDVEVLNDVTNNDEQLSGQMDRKQLKQVT